MRRRLLCHRRRSQDLDPDANMLKNAAIFIALLTCAGLLAGAPPAAAHAIVVSAAPQVDSVVPGPDVAVELRFNSRLDLERSRLTLVLPDGSSRPITVETTASPAVLAGKISARTAVVPICGRNIDARLHEHVVATAAEPSPLRRLAVAA